MKEEVKRKLIGRTNHKLLYRVLYLFLFLDRLNTRKKVVHRRRKSVYASPILPLLYVLVIGRVHSFVWSQRTHKLDTECLPGHPGDSRDWSFDTTRICVHHSFVPFPLTQKHTVLTFIEQNNHIFSSYEISTRCRKFSKCRF